MARRSRAAAAPPPGWPRPSIDAARKLPEQLVGLPVLAVGIALQASLKAQQTYAGLVARGDEVLDRLRGEDEPGLATFDDDEPAAPGRRRPSTLDRAPSRAADDGAPTRVAAEPVRRADARGRRGGRRWSPRLVEATTATRRTRRRRGRAGDRRPGRRGDAPTLRPRSRHRARRRRADGGEVAAAAARRPSAGLTVDDAATSTRPPRGAGRRAAGAAPAPSRRHRHAAPTAMALAADAAAARAALAADTRSTAPGGDRRSAGLRRLSVAQLRGRLRGAVGRAGRGRWSAYERATQARGRRT